MEDAQLETIFFYSWKDQVTRWVAGNVSLFTLSHLWLPTQPKLTNKSNWYLTNCPSEANKSRERGWCFPCCRIRSNIPTVGAHFYCVLNRDFLIDFHRHFTGFSVHEALLDFEKFPCIGERVATLSESRRSLARQLRIDLKKRRVQ